VQEVLVCNPRRNALLKEGSKSDKVDARKLAELLRTGMGERRRRRWKSPRLLRPELIAAGSKEKAESP
jgi:hypothetical protein